MPSHLDHALVGVVLDTEQFARVAAELALQDTYAVQLLGRHGPQIAGGQLQLPPAHIDDADAIYRLDGTDDTLCMRVRVWAKMRASVRAAAGERERERRKQGDDDCNYTSQLVRVNLSAERYPHSAQNTPHGPVVCGQKGRSPAILEPDRQPRQMWRPPLPGSRAPPKASRHSPRGWAHRRRGCSPAYTRQVSRMACTRNIRQLQKRRGGAGERRGRQRGKCD